MKKLKFKDKLKLAWICLKSDFKSSEPTREFLTYEEPNMELAEKPKPKVKSKKFIYDDSIKRNTLHMEALDALKTYGYWMKGNTKAPSLEVFKKLTYVTENYVMPNKLYLAPNQEDNSDISNLVVYGIGNVRIDDEMGFAQFSIDLIEPGKKENIVKRLIITQPLCEEIKQNNTKAYEIYADNPNKCFVEEMQKGSVIVYESYDGKQKVTAFADEKNL